MRVKLSPHCFSCGGPSGLCHILYCKPCRSPLSSLPGPSFLPRSAVGHNRPTHPLFRIWCVSGSQYGIICFKTYTCTSCACACTSSPARAPPCVQERCVSGRIWPLIIRFIFLSCGSAAHHALHVCNCAQMESRGQLNWQQRHSTRCLRIPLDLFFPLPLWPPCAVQNLSVEADGVNTGFLVAFSNVDIRCFAAASMACSRSMTCSTLWLAQASTVMTDMAGLEASLVAWKSWGPSFLNTHIINIWHSHFPNAAFVPNSMYSSLLISLATSSSTVATTGTSMDILNATGAFPNNEDWHQVYVLVVTSNHIRIAEGLLPRAYAQPVTRFWRAACESKLLMQVFLLKVLVELLLSHLLHSELFDKDHESPTWLQEATPSENPNATEGCTKIRDASNSSGGNDISCPWGWDKSSSHWCWASQRSCYGSP